MNLVQINLKRVVTFCIGSKHYKKINKEKFILSLNELEPYLVLMVVSKLHITGLYYDTLKSLKLNVKYNNTLESFIFYRNLTNSIIQKELNSIGKETKEYKPILLKGPSFWKNKDKLYLRQVFDVDIYIPYIEHSGNIENLFKELNFCKVLDSQEDYVSSAFIKNIMVDLKEIERSKVLCCLLNFGNREVLFDNQLKVPIKIEIHSKLFAHEDSFKTKFNILNTEDFSFISGFKVFKNIFNLPYLSSKLLLDIYFYLDGNQNKAKSFKMFRDIIEIISKLNLDEIEKSNLIADELFSLSDYQSIILSIAEYVPELNLSNSSKSENDILNLFLNEFLKNFG